MPARRSRLVFAAGGLAIVAVVVVTLTTTSPTMPVDPTDRPTQCTPVPGTPDQQVPSAAPRMAAAVGSAPSSPRVAMSPTGIAVGDPIGRVQPVPASANPQVASVASAILQHDHPERLSALTQPPAFNAAAYAADPVRYANEVVPGRALQSAAPGPGVPILMPLVSTQMSIAQDQQTILRVKSQPGSPVTFTSFDLGRFGNSLVSQTVVTDASGVGSVSFTAGPGTTDAVHVLAGSPGASGQVLFDIMVTPAATPRTGI